MTQTNTGAAMADTEVERKWDELADRGDLRVFMQRIDNRFDRIKRLHWIEIFAIVCGLVVTSLK
ncbi:MAG: hypothetical protein O3A54_01575 [Actinobacteria bacterium]|nr:hypothetical protein [Actinomycetota bacterium]